MHTNCAWLSIFTEYYTSAEPCGINTDAPNPLQGFNLMPPILEICAEFYKENGTSVIAPRGKGEEKANHFRCDRWPPIIVRSVGGICVHVRASVGLANTDLVTVTKSITEGQQG